MIASLFGTIKSLRSEQVVIEVNGVGYLVQISPKTSAQLAIGRDALIFTSMVVREDAMTLYGFTKDSDRQLFELVQTVSGFGPKVSLALTQALDIEGLAALVNRKDESSLSTIPGIGKKSAQRLILELTGKLDYLAPVTQKLESSWRTELIEALIGLGFARKQAESAINQLASENSLDEINSLSSSERLKLALSHANSLKGLSK